MIKGPAHQDKVVKTLIIPGKKGMRLHSEMIQEKIK
jgi:hypothetical protein